MIKLRDLEYLDAIERHKHFGRAAQACFVSQPTLSAQIMKLEEQLDLQLIERHRKAVMLTPAGEQLVQDARRVLKEAHRFEESAKALRDPFAGEMHVGIIPTLAPYILPHIMDVLNETLPNVQFFLYEDKTKNLLAELEEGKMDVLILPWLKGMEKYERYDVFDEPLLLALHDSHPLADLETLTLDSLKGQPVLTLQDGHCLRGQSLDYCFSAGADEDPRFQATSLETLRFMVASNLGMTLLPWLATLNQVSSKNIRYKRFSDPQPMRNISLVIRPNYSRMSCVRQIVANVRKVIGDLLESRSALPSKT